MSASEISSSSLTLQDSPKPQKDDIQPELLGLIKKIDALTSFSGYYMSTFHPDYNSAREIYLGLDPQGSGKVFIKTPRIRSARITAPFAVKEQLAFLISERLGFHVVPPTMALSGYKWIRDNYSKEKKDYLSNGIDDTCKGAVVQEGVLLHPDQIHMNNKLMLTRWHCRMTLNVSEDEADILLEKNAKPLLDFGLVVDQICKAILFNIVTGRKDAGKRNTVIDDSKKVLEVDNEHIGNNHITDSWLIGTFSTCVISKTVIDDFLARDISVIDTIFQEMKLRFGPMRNRNPETKTWDVKDQSKRNIKSNFVKLRNFLLHRRDREIKVRDLRSRFYTKPTLDML